jgi:hypothetical protein
LRFLAPWPLAAALIILVVGYVRRKRPAPAPADENAAAPDGAVRPDLRGVTNRPTS